MINRLIHYFLENKLVTMLLMLVLIGWGLASAPFDWELGSLPRDPVPVDAIPDLGENQQIVFTEWNGRSPQDIEDQVTYPLTTSLLGIPGVRTIRSSSVFGLSSIYVIFEEGVEFYWSRSRILEKLNSLPSEALPAGVQPTLGPDATALGQVFWYTLEGRDSAGRPTGGWDLHEIRTVQDFYVKYALNGVQGVSEVASIGGYVQEYQVDVDPDALRIYGISLDKVLTAVKRSNRDVGAKTIEINKAEYLIRGLGYIRSIEDIEQAVVDVSHNTPIHVGDVAFVTLGPANRRGLLDKDGAEVVGGVAVARYGSNPLKVIDRIKDKIQEISSGLPNKTLSDGTVSQLTVVPFYDRTTLIHETLGTLETALSLEILITLLVVIVMVLDLGASLLISALLPLAVLMTFIAMRYFHVDANIVALSGIAIAIGTMVDLGIILTENIWKHKDEAPPDQRILKTVYLGASEVSSAIITAVATTIVSFIPVFALQAAEGKLFTPLAFTKTFALVASLIVALLILPTFAHWILGFRSERGKGQKALHALLCAAGLILVLMSFAWAGWTLVCYGAAWFLQRYGPWKGKGMGRLPLIIALGSVVVLLTGYWRPLGVQQNLFVNFLFVGSLLALILLFFYLLERKYESILRWCMAHKRRFLLIPLFLILLGSTIWFGFDSIFGPLARGMHRIGVPIQRTLVWNGMARQFPGLGKEFMPALDEGSFLLMPSSMPHAGMEQNKRVVQQLDMLLANVPEVELAVGKMGRAETALDPAPISMYENVINYKTEYMVDGKGHPLRFKVDRKGRFVLRSGDTLAQGDALAAGIGRSDLMADRHGHYYRNWREHIRTPDDIWKEIERVTVLPGVTSAPKLQPIETRLVMLQTGMRAPMGIKVFGPDLETIQSFGIQLEEILKGVPSVKSEAVFADRIVGKPYIQLRIDRRAIARYGLTIEDVQSVVESAIGGMAITNTVEGRRRFPVRVRYPREYRDDPDQLMQILVTAPGGLQIPMGELVHVEYTAGPQAIKTENTFPVGYVLFDKRSEFAEVSVVQDAKRSIQEHIDNGSLQVPAGISYTFSGSYENQVRAEKRLSILVPVVLLLILLILYFQFRSLSTSLMIFAGVAMAFSGAFILIWLYAEPWFMNWDVAGTNMRDLFRMHPINLSVAVWVGFIALFGIATDDGVLMATYLDQRFTKGAPTDLKEVREAVVHAGKRRIRPAIMTTATTIIALLPVLSSSGKGADIMIPMAIPAFGGMAVASITYFIVPVLYSWREERRLKSKKP